MTQQYDPNRHHRRSIRLKGYDYSSAGAYFVTICTRDRECVLIDPVVTGIIIDVWEALPGWFPTIALDEFVVMPNHIHLIVWLWVEGVDGAGASPAPTGNVDDDVGATLAVAPNTVAPNTVAPDAVAPDAVASDTIVPDVIALDGIAPWIIPIPQTTNPNPTLGDVIGAFKSLVFTVYLDWIQVNDAARRAKFWQRNYYEHIIRDEQELHAIRRYIHHNPAQWALDRDNPKNSRHLPLPLSIEDYLADIRELMNDKT